MVGHWEPIGEGGIYILDLSAPEVSSASKMTIIGSKSFEKEKFHPAGISVFEGEDGRIFLFAASLASQQIDVFEVLVQEKKLKHLRVIRDPLFHGVNNLVAISSNSFFVTNYCKNSKISFGDKKKISQIFFAFFPDLIEFLKFLKFSFLKFPI